MQTDRTIPNTKPDVIINDNDKRTYILIDFAIYGDRKVITKEVEEILKYKELTIEIQCVWNVRGKVISVTTGAN